MRKSKGPNKICPANSHEIGLSYQLFFGKVSHENFPGICL